MKYNCRFNPTISGNLHCGHLYTALVNAREAHKSNGEFILRIDDTQEYWNKQLGSTLVKQLGNDYIDELSQFMFIDKIEWQSELPCFAYTNEVQGLNGWVHHPSFIHDDVPEWIPDPNTILYPFTAWYTFEKVLWDYVDKVNWLIRGEDLITEFSLYEFFRDALHLPRVRHTYLPRLRTEEQKELAGVSKTFGSYKLCDQLKLFGVDGTLDYLRQSCLINVDGDFEVANIKCRPTIVGFVPH
jgi:hypothetical protein